MVSNMQISPILSHDFARKRQPQMLTAAFARARKAKSPAFVSHDCKRKEKFTLFFCLFISLKEVSGEGLCCFRQVNNSDVLTLLELRDVREIVQDTIDKIRSDFSRVSAVYSVNCIFRYLVFENNHMTSDYLSQMGSLGSHCGLVGFGEHNNDQFVNQTMTCVVFE